MHNVWNLYVVRMMEKKLTATKQALLGVNKNDKRSDKRRITHKIGIKGGIKPIGIISVSVRCLKIK